jgi:hypothetical protein
MWRNIRSFTAAAATGPAGSNAGTELINTGPSSWFKVMRP